MMAMAHTVDGEALAALLARHKEEMRRRFGVEGLALFGSAARGEARADSDIDILVSFDGPADSERYFGVLFYLEDLLGRTVDLVTDKALRPELRPFVEAEAIPVSTRVAVLRPRHDRFLREGRTPHTRA